MSVIGWYSLALARVASFFAYPLKAATAIAVNAVRGFVDKSEDFDEIVFCCYSGEDLAVYKRASPDG